MTNTDSITSAPGSVTWFEVHTADPERAKAFYASVFGWTYDDEAMPGYSMIGMGDGAPIGGGIADTGGAWPDGAMFLIQVPDVSTALGRVKEHGGSIVTDTQKAPNGLTFGYAANPDGSVFGLWCPPAG